MLSRRSRRRVAGLSLVELMIAIAVGLLLLVGLSSVYVNTARGGRTTAQTNQLSQEMRALMDIMVNDVRRAGYWGAPADGVANPFTAATTRPTITGACLLYSYDATYAGGTAGVVDPSDHFGFRRTAGGVVQMVRPGTLTSTANTSFCSASDASGWENLTDERAIEVTTLAFDTIGSKCMALDPAVYDPTEVAEPPTTFKQWVTTTGAGPACDAAASGAPSPYPDTATHQFIETRQVNITLTARNRTDATLPALTLTERVLIRNNRVILPP